MGAQFNVVAQARNPRFAVDPVTVQAKSGADGTVRMEEGVVHKVARVKITRGRDFAFRF